MKEAKIKYYQNKINQNKGNTANLWQCVNEIVKNNAKKGEIREIKVESGDTSKDNYEISNTFTKYFTQIGGKLADAIKQKSNAHLHANITKMSNSIFISETNEAEIKETILMLKNNKAPGIDNITAEILKYIANEIVAPLTYIINISIKTGKFPSAFKIAVIKPVYKNGDQLEVANYRPISLISNLAKVFEMLLKKRIISYLDKYHILSDKQFGFRENRSTQDAIEYLTSKISKSIDEKCPTLCIFVDLAKAFDTVDHSQLLRILEGIGFRGTSYNLMNSYLSNRTQCTKINNVISSTEIVKYGVPQGTVLGPILFNIYLNDLYKLPVEGDVVSFADDTAIIYKASDWKILKATAETDFKHIIEWFDSRLLTINFSKTHYIPFTSYSRHLPDFDSLSISTNNINIVISSVRSIKYLGIMIDCHLKWDIHINYLISKLRYTTYRFKYLSRLLSINQMRTLYYALIESHITYGIVAWGAAANSYIKNLEIVQKCILKIIYHKTNTYPTNELYSETNIFDPRQLFFLTVITRQQKHKNKLVNIEHNYNTRYRQNASHLPKPEKNILLRSYIYLGPKLYNLIPHEMKQINSLNLFKNKLRKWMRQIPRLQIHQFVDIKNTYVF